MAGFGHFRGWQKLGSKPFSAPSPLASPPTHQLAKSSLTPTSLQPHKPPSPQTLTSSTKTPHFPTSPLQTIAIATFIGIILYNPQIDPTNFTAKFSPKLKSIPIRHEFLPYIYVKNSTPTSGQIRPKLHHHSHAILALQTPQSLDLSARNRPKFRPNLPR